MKTNEELIMDAILGNQNGSMEECQRQVDLVRAIQNGKYTIKITKKGMSDKQVIERLEALIHDCMFDSARNIAKEYGYNDLVKYYENKEVQEK